MAQPRVRDDDLELPARRVRTGRMLKVAFFRDPDGEGLYLAELG